MNFETNNTANDRPITLRDGEGDFCQKMKGVSQLFEKKVQMEYVQLPKAEVSLIAVLGKCSGTEIKEHVLTLKLCKITWPDKTPLSSRDLYKNIVTGCQIYGWSLALPNWSSRDTYSSTEYPSVCNNSSLFFIVFIVADSAVIKLRLINNKWVYFVKMLSQ